MTLAALPPGGKCDRESRKAIIIKEDKPASELETLIVFSPVASGERLSSSQRTSANQKLLFVQELVIEDRGYKSECLLVFLVPRFAD